jgi:hypothetical protein
VSCPTRWMHFQYLVKLPVLKHVVFIYSVTEVELKRAKNSTISSVLMNLESRVILNPRYPFLVLSVTYNKF